MLHGLCRCSTTGTFCGSHSYTTLFSSNDRGCRICCSGVFILLLCKCRGEAQFAVVAVFVSFFRLLNNQESVSYYRFSPLTRKKTKQILTFNKWYPSANNQKNTQQKATTKTTESNDTQITQRLRSYVVLTSMDGVMRPLSMAWMRFKDERAVLMSVRASEARGIT